MSLVVLGCGLGWGALAALPFIVRMRRSAVTVRLGPVTPIAVRRGRLRWRSGPVGRVIRGLLLRRRNRAEDRRILGELPAVLDLIGVAMSAGATPRGALETAARWGPPVIAVHLRQVLVAAELGGSFVDAAGRLGEAAPRLAPVAEILVTSAHLGAPAGGSLARLGDETRSTLRRAAEARARTLPVKLLFPLVFLVLPAFGLLTVVPAILSAMQRL